MATRTRDHRKLNVQMRLKENLIIMAVILIISIGVVIFS